MICTGCGTYNEDNRFRCKSCYHKLPASEAVSAERRERVSTPARNRPQKVLNINQPASAGQSITHSPSSVSLEEMIDRNLADHKKALYEAPPPRQSFSTMFFGYNSTERFLVYGVLAVLVIGIGLAAMVFVSSAEDNNLPAKVFFSRAENYYRSHDYATALTLFQQFVHEHRDYELAPLAASRVEEIAWLLDMEDLDRRVELQRLLGFAETAFAEQRYLRPPDNNVIKYCDDILAIDPDSRPAKLLKRKVVDAYRDLADRAERAYRYDAALQHYLSILTIIPEDDDTQDRLSLITPLAAGEVISSSNVAGKMQSAGNSRQAALEERKQMRLLRSEAQRAGADEMLAFDTAMKRQTEADKKLRSGQYAEAANLYQRATKLFSSARNIRVKQLRNRARVLLSEMNTAKAEANRRLAHMRAVQPFEVAQQKELQARQSMSANQYQEAIPLLEEANRLYLSAAKVAQNAS